MPLKSFSILVPFDGITTMAEVQEVESPLNFVYKVTFQNGYENVFTPFEGEDDESDSGWNEAGLGQTQLSKEVGHAINFYVIYETEPTIIQIDDEKYFILPQPKKDQTLYQVYRERLLCVLSRNTEGQWQADCEMDDALVQKIGRKIETEEI